MDVEQKYLALLFSTADADHDGKISGGEGVAFLRRSGLPDQQLMQIWDLSDSRKAGFLQKPEFDIAMKLIAMGQHGAPLSVKDVYSYAEIPTFTGIDPPVMIPLMDENDVYKYDNLFLQADVNHDGYVDGIEARNYFMKAKISTEALAKIWELSELDKDGKLNQIEFRLAMHLVYFVIRNPAAALPNVLPVGLLGQVRDALSQFRGNVPTSQPLPTSLSVTQPSPLGFQPTQQQPISQPTYTQPSQPQPHGVYTQPVPYNTTAVAPLQTFDPNAFANQQTQFVFPTTTTSHATPATNDLVFTPDTSTHTYDQSKQIAQYTLPGASFEQRVNFNNELADALNKKKNKP